MYNRKIPMIEVSNIWKKYHIGVNLPYYSFRDSIANLVKNPLQLLIRKERDEEGLTDEEFWALQRVSFQVNRGEVIGIIGKNGAGKSTLLRILSRITYPTRGEVRLRGRVVSLLEVGTGFHSELTGRENIYLNGAILGMTRREIQARFSEIVDFAEIERFLDTPVKFYSSGMVMRLAFSVAAHLAGEIMLVDEVLAVGDAQFQKKCLGKMDEVTKKGRTVLFVSHNLGAVKSLCKKGIFMENGLISEYSNIDNLINHYQLKNSALNNTTDLVLRTNKMGLIFSNLKLNGFPLANLPEIFSGEVIKVSADYTCEDFPHDLCISLGIKGEKDTRFLIYTHNHLENIKHLTGNKGSFLAKLLIPKIAPGVYHIEMQVWLDGNIVFEEQKIGYFRIIEVPAFASGSIFASFPSDLLVDSKWYFKHE